MKLIELPNGIWINPAHIISLSPNDVYPKIRPIEDIPPHLCITMIGGVVVNVPAVSLDVAIGYARAIARDAAN